MISCMQESLPKNYRSRMKRSLLPVVTFPFRHLVCLFLTLHLLMSVFLGGANASYERRLQTRNPFLFDNALPSPSFSGNGYSETGVASWYGPDFHGKRTSSGERYDMHALTAAHRLLPMDTLLLVKNLDNGRETIVRVNDRGPFVKERILDLSHGAAKALRVVGKGTARVKVMVVSETGMPLQTLPQQQTLALADEGFFVQIGAFALEKNAVQMQKRLTNAGHSTTVTKVTGKKATVYRVLIFTGRDREKALLAKRTLQQRGHHEAFIVAR